ncbi:MULTISPECIES: RpiB/LacA/LacB family sugar-phosphate isomerase [unclassified Mesorhizobium]|uniref:D-erythrulose-4-phosphate isomerase n=1 Tax=unclassified Mesorhizobium TaxID=325217 RepID=UPI000F7541D4|nr:MULTISPECIES: RpiB/LacA/LacB family sugar-phosphate isomerase [unclassified Mesorhizobium]AZO22745.1 ribose 5-phosphate isomerase B [Mesorhizobium sp. M1E.F.Ca.ET.045.02.1.1]RUW28716.1 RpiB/LacA/LacB family sugar-phosphate isomerase [Mesorhizobium sp. M1E.F.Ca.ET.041.01.1.1]RUW84328.1 RpiB/LacA/LacB family sugar-phosphate isomerase [Mesorhizobium sp. M1E.F.Ca.ET.063.01.1.1]RWD88024.1 MAG: RpiB/LacA/LacB family sugar-phosphate isomerase [Mesorhizobium sp.]RWD94050.1 MAG: RpiB/LacA/LacB famil
MRLAVAGDSAGEGLAKVLADYLKDKHEVSEVSRTEAGPDPFYANLSDRVASDLLAGKYDRAILICGTGIGVCISANKVPGIRAALTHDTYSAERAALSNNAQIITMGARVVGTELAKAIADAYLKESFDPKGRSAGNVAAIDDVDAKYNAR